MVQNRSTIVTDDEIAEAWGHANFGSLSRRNIIIDTLTKVAQGWGTGHTAMCIVRELGLVERRNDQDGLSDKGLKYLLANDDLFTKEQVLRIVTAFALEHDTEVFMGYHQTFEEEMEQVKDCIKWDA
jgi:hypothetical protein